MEGQLNVIRNGDGAIWQHTVILRGGGGLCSGTLLSATLILTAAHCFYGREFRGVTVLDKNHRTIGRGIKIRRHHSYNSHYGIDIAIAEYENISGISTFAKCGDELENCRLSGYSTYPNRAFSLTATVKHRDCGHFWLPHGNLCFYTRRGSGVYFGDSGGSVYCNDKIVGVITAMTGGRDVGTSIISINLKELYTTGINSPNLFNPDKDNKCPDSHDTIPSPGPTKPIEPSKMDTILDIVTKIYKILTNFPPQFIGITTPEPPTTPKHPKNATSPRPANVSSTDSSR